MIFNIPINHENFVEGRSLYGPKIRDLVGKAWRWSVLYRTDLSNGSTALDFKKALTEAKEACDEVVQHYVGYVIGADSYEEVLNLLRIQRISENLGLMLSRVFVEKELDEPDVIDDYFRPITDANNLARTDGFLLSADA